MLGTLSVSQTGLNASKYAIDSIGNNQANANTTGYKKRVVGLSEIGQVNGIMTGRGVYFDGVTRVTSQYMYDKMISESSKNNYYTKMSNLIGGVESVFKETAESGFSADLNRYYQSLENLRTNPSSEIYKNELKRNGQILVDSLQNKYTTIQDQQKYEKVEFNANIERVNNLLGDIAKVNDKIQKFGTATNDLLDKRDLLELELSQYVDISVNRDSDFYELKIGNQTVISNNTNVQPINAIEVKTNQIDKFNHIEYHANNTFTIYDSLKYNDDYSSKNIDAGDIITFKLNNQHSVSVTMGETLMADLGDGAGLQSVTVDINNLTRVMTYKINSDANLKDVVTAYNGDYSLDANGNKITNNSQDNYLRLESNLPGVENSFDARFSIEKRDTAGILETTGNVRESIYKNEVESKEPQSDIGIAIYEREINVSSGIMKAQMENLSTSSPNNKYQQYLDKLDAFAMTFGDISNEYIKIGQDEYIYGSAASDNYDSEIINSLGLFTGSSVKTLEFNAKVVNTITQSELDYLATIQWKIDLTYDGKGQDSTSKNTASLNDFFRDIRVAVSADKESNDFLQETQEAIYNSLENTYNNLVKVDSDDEMLNLMKFQAAFTANAQIITAINEMIQTILGMRR
ncbi:flagellar hook-associated protein FlgK [Arcobacter vandammei]|uniref:flagellar hook-associated protein FlgK n=1 Tax=Arcobacter vandammei TaxID=2782243 RepID=UPI0018DEFD50|nr:flagellar basal body rod C-terminal domain-containing protein [Arcobacter vandammei]